MLETNVAKILVVDDEVELKNALVEALSAHSFEVRGFTDGAHALSALRQEAFDVLLSDLMMPELDGITLIEKALEIDPHLVPIIMTGQGTIQTAVDAMKIGAFDYVLKPFRLATMLPTLTRAINARRLRLENMQLRETVAIYELCQTIAMTLDEQALISKLADAALQQTEADEVSILLPTSSGEELYVAAVRGENRQRLLGERVPLEESISGWVVRQREPLLLSGEVKDARFHTLWPHPEIKSALSIPMQAGNKLIGTININALNRTRPFTLGQMKALTILASAAAAALESASLFGQLRTAEANYRSIFENAVEGIFQSTPEGRFLAVNPAMARILGHDSPADLIANITDVTTQIYVDPADRDKAAQLEEERGVIHAFEFEAYRKDRERIWLSLNRRSVRDEKGVELYREGSIENITERKRAEQALQSSEAEVRALFAAITDVIIVFDADGRYLKIAPTNSTDSYKPPDDLIGRTQHEILPKETADFLVSHIRRALDEGRAHRVEYRVELEGTEVWFDGSVAPLSPNSVIWIARDITERKRAEDEQARLNAEIKQQTDRLNTIVATVPGVVFEVSGTPGAPNNKTNFVSEYIGPMLGYTVAEWLSVPGFWLSIVHPDDRQRVGKQAAADFAQGQNGGHDFRWMAKDGRIVWVRAHTIVVRDENGKPVGVRGVVTDITEGKRVEEMQARRETHALFRADVGAALALSRAPLRSTLESCAEAMVKHLHAAFARVWTLNREENVLELQASAGIYTHIDGAQARVPVGKFKIGKIAQERSPHITNDVQHDPRVSDHEWARQEKMVAFAGYPLLVEDRLLGVMAMFSREKLTEDTLDAMASVADVISQGIERKRAEQELSKSEERYRDLVENAHDIIYSHDLQGNYTSMNKAAELITGYTPEEALSMNLSQMMPAEYLPTAQEMVNRKLAGEKVTAYETELIAKDGHRVAVEANTKLVFQDGVPVGVQGIARDVTERKQLEDQLRQSQKLEGIGQLAGGVAHDFNNLLTAINGYTSLALQRLDEHNSVRPYLEEVKKAGDRAANLTRQLLAFGRKQILQPIPLDLNSIVSDMNKMLRRLIGEDINLAAKLATDLRRIKADPGQIEQVLMNLVVNARDAMPQGGKLTIETTNVELDLEYTSTHVGVNPGAYVVLAVSDTGTGMSEQVRKQIFEPFFTTKEKGKGTGLGLSTVYGVVKQSEGNIWVYSEPNHGTTFRVYLPALASTSISSEAKAAESPIPRGSETVLLVEDEEVVRGLARQILEDAGYHVLVAQQGEEAVRLCNEHTSEIHLLLTDVVMPGAGGKVVAERLSALRPGIKVLFMSGYTDEAIVHHGVLDSNVKFIQKPFSPLGLSKKVREVLDSNGHTDRD
ncbi:MAG TPA: hypothetical protein DC054_13840 [Blastocatellia bacterium]|nr:hypothetical protein [Blastocatellia bacterium]